MNKLDFDYVLLNEVGTCRGVSVSQAIDHAKVRYLSRRGIKVNTPVFRFEKPKLSAYPITLSLAEAHIKRFKELYRARKDDDLRTGELEELERLSSIIKDKRISL